jgi:hypothetical protein
MFLPSTGLTLTEPHLLEPSEITFPESGVSEKPANNFSAFNQANKLLLPKLL